MLVVEADYVDHWQEAWRLQLLLRPLPARLRFTGVNVGTIGTNVPLG